MQVIQFLDAHHFDYSLESALIDEASRDSSVFKVRPTAIVYPRTVDELGTLVKNAPGNYVLAPRAGGTCMSGGSLTTGIVVDMKKHMHQILIKPEARHAEVDMGAYYRDIEKIASAHGLMFAPYTSSKDVCGIGGMVGNNASGEKSVRFGATIDNIEKVWVVLSDGNEYEFGVITESEFQERQERDTFEGELYRELGHILFGAQKGIAPLVRQVSKCATGYRLERVHDIESGTYNLAALFIGAQGTLGIVTRAILKLVPLPSHKMLLAVPVPDLEKLPSVLMTVMAHHPEGCETFDANTYEYAKAFLPQETAAIADVMGKSHLMILAQFAESSLDDTKRIAYLCMSELTRKGIVAHVVEDEAHADNYWKVRRSSFRVLRDGVKGTTHAVPCIEDIIVPIEHFDELVPQLMHILEERDIQYGYHGHIGDGALRIIPLFDMADPQTPQRIIELCEVTFALVDSLGGHMSADHSDGIIRTPFVADFYGPSTYRLFVAVKKLFDPDSIFNPGKKIGGTRADIERYIIRA
jgi:FAD/FMN-containing dehydrogenase